MESIESRIKAIAKERIEAAGKVTTKGTDYTFEKPINRMQQYMVAMLKEHHIYGNWSSTGAGKTNSALVAGRVLGCRVMLIICPNSVKNDWVAAIMGEKNKDGEKVKKGAYEKNSRVIDFATIDDIEEFDRGVYNYIILNYDKFSVSSMNGGRNMIDKLLALNKIDFICLDELQFVKARTNSDSKRRECVLYLREKAAEMNPDIYITGMTATPAINNIRESRSLVELMTGKKYEDVGDTKSFSNILQAHKAIINNGVRYVRNHGIHVENLPINIDGTDIAADILGCYDRCDKILAIEKILAEKKMSDPNVIKAIKKGTIIFSYYRDARHSDAILNIIKDKLDEIGLTYVVYAGGGNGRDEVKERFRNGDVDVMIATKPISTGVNGLQDVCNRMIMIGYPWTGAEYDQLVGRINRQGSNFDVVYIYHPCVNIKMSNGKTWSYDRDRMGKIRSKKELADAILDGKFDRIYEINPIKMVGKLLKDLKDGMATDYTPERESL